MDNLYEFSGYFIPIRFNLTEPYRYFYVEIDPVSWADLIDEIKIYCRNNKSHIDVKPIKDGDFLHIKYFVDGLLIGYKSYTYLGVSDDEIII